MTPLHFTRDHIKIVQKISSQKVYYINYERFPKNITQQDLIGKICVRFSNRIHSILASVAYFDASLICNTRTLSGQLNVSNSPNTALCNSQVSTGVVKSNPTSPRATTPGSLSASLILLLIPSLNKWAFFGWRPTAFPNPCSLMNTPGYDSGSQKTLTPPITLTGISGFMPTLVVGMPCNVTVRPFSCSLVIVRSAWKCESIPSIRFISLYPPPCTDSWFCDFGASTGTSTFNTAV